MISCPPPKKKKKQNKQKHQKLGRKNRGNIRNLIFIRVWQPCYWYVSTLCCNYIGAKAKATSLGMEHRFPSCVFTLSSDKDQRSFCFRFRVRSSIILPLVVLFLTRKSFSQRPTACGPSPVLPPHPWVQCNWREDYKHRWEGQSFVTGSFLGGGGGGAGPYSMRQRNALYRVIGTPPHPHHEEIDRHKYHLHFICVTCFWLRLTWVNMVFTACFIFIFLFLEHFVSELNLVYPSGLICDHSKSTIFSMAPILLYSFRYALTSR